MAIVPTGTPAWRAGLSSAFFGGVAALFVALTVDRWTSSRPAGYKDLLSTCLTVR